MDAATQTVNVAEAATQTCQEDYERVIALTYDAEVIDWAPVAYNAAPSAVLSDVIANSAAPHASFPEEGQPDAVPFNTAVEVSTTMLSMARRNDENDDEENISWLLTPLRQHILDTAYSSEIQDMHARLMTAFVHYDDTDVAVDPELQKSLMQQDALIQDGDVEEAWDCMEEEFDPSCCMFCDQAANDGVCLACLRERDKRADPVGLPLPSLDWHSDEEDDDDEAFDTADYRLPLCAR